LCNESLFLFLCHLDEVLLFHGTDSCNISLIFTENFRPDARPVNREKASAFGNGIYFSDNFSTALRYGSSKTVILSRVLLGKVDTGANMGRFELMNERQMPKDCDSKSVGSGYTGIRVVKSPDQVLPFCIIHMNLTMQCNRGLSAFRYT
jgi:hypothetical protein